MGIFVMYKEVRHSMADVTEHSEVAFPGLLPKGRHNREF